MRWRGGRTGRQADCVCVWWLYWYYCRSIGAVDGGGKLDAVSSTGSIDPVPTTPLFYPARKYLSPQTHGKFVLFRELSVYWNG
jgi:hypothetical protein